MANLLSVRSFLWGTPIDERITFFAPTVDAASGNDAARVDAYQPADRDAKFPLSVTQPPSHAYAVLLAARTKDDSGMPPMEATVMVGSPALSGRAGATGLEDSQVLAPLYKGHPLFDDSWDRNSVENKNLSTENPFYHTFLSQLPEDQRNWVITMTTHNNGMARTDAANSLVAAGFIQTLIDQFNNVFRPAYKENRLAIENEVLNAKRENRAINSTLVSDHVNRIIGLSFFMELIAHISFRASNSQLHLMTTLTHRTHLLGTLDTWLLDGLKQPTLERVFYRNDEIFRWLATFLKISPAERMIEYQNAISNTEVPLPTTAELRDDNFRAILSKKLADIYESFYNFRDFKDGLAFLLMELDQSRLLMTTDELAPIADGRNRLKILYDSLAGESEAIIPPTVVPEIQWSFNSKKIIFHPNIDQTIQNLRANGYWPDGGGNEGDAVSGDDSGTPAASPEAQILSRNSHVQEGLEALEKLKAQVPCLSLKELVSIVVFALESDLDHLDDSISAEIGYPPIFNDYFMKIQHFLKSCAAGNQVYILNDTALAYHHLLAIKNVRDFRRRFDHNPPLPTLTGVLMAFTEEHKKIPNPEAILYDNSRSQRVRDTIAFLADNSSHDELRKAAIQYVEEYDIVEMRDLVKRLYPSYQEGSRRRINKDKDSVKPLNDPYYDPYEDDNIIIPFEVFSAINDLLVMLYQKAFNLIYIMDGFMTYGSAVDLLYDLIVQTQLGPRTLYALLCDMQKQKTGPEALQAIKALSLALEETKLPLEQLVSQKAAELLSAMRPDIMPELEPLAYPKPGEGLLVRLARAASSKKIDGGGIEEDAVGYYDETISLDEEVATGDELTDPPQEDGVASKRSGNFVGRHVRNIHNPVFHGGRMTYRASHLAKVFRTI